MNTKLLLGSAVVSCIILSGTLSSVRADEQADKDAKKADKVAADKASKTSAAKTTDKSTQAKDVTKTTDKTVHTTDKTTVVRKDDQVRHDDRGQYAHDDHRHEYIVRNGHRGYWINIAGVQIWVDADI